MRDKSQLRGYQSTSTAHVLSHPQSMLWIDMSLGKTAITLTAVAELLDSANIWGVLVVAPLRVCQSVWRQEAAEWSHLNHLKFSLISGSKQDRIHALYRRADIYLINYENLVWLADEIKGRWLSRGKYPPFSCVIWDEISRLKNTRTRQGVKSGKAALRLLEYLPHRIGMTGTPASNGLLDLYGQYLVVDGGERLGTSFTRFREEYFYRADHNGYRWLPREGAQPAIINKVKDITISLALDDYLDLPPFIYNDIYVDLPPPIMDKYKELENKFFIEFDSGAKLEIDNQVSLNNRCLQFASGACFVAPGSPKWEMIHTAKLDAFEEVVEEAAGDSMLAMYQFRHEAERVQKKYKKAELINSSLSESEFLELNEAWNARQLPMMLGHPLSIGHGLNLQYGSNKIVWLGGTWSLGFVPEKI